MAIELFEHNLTAYHAAVAMLAETGKAAVIHPTGTGKSFIGFKLCEDNPDRRILWLSPSEYIFRTQLENWSAAGGMALDNIVFLTYAKLILMSDEEIEELKPDIEVYDEYHRGGASCWQVGIERLRKIHSDVPMLGLSATNIRYLDNQRDMADELFDGNIASEMTLGEAIVRGILNPPKYILSIYSFAKDFEKYEKRVHSAKSKAVRDEASKYLEALRRALENAEGLDVLFDKHMTDRHGKYIVFAPNYETMQEYIGMAKDWFGRVDKDMHIYSVYSDDPSASRSFRDFKADDSDHLRLLYCIDALNEGVHVEDVSGVILMRPTISPIIYKQQIGRALSASKSKEPVIFDIVNNIENLYSIDSIREEMQNAIFYYRSLGNGEYIVNDTFEIIDKVAECRRLFDELEGTLTASWEIMYTIAERYYQEHGNLDPPKRLVSEEGYSLGAWLVTQRRVRSGKVNGILTDEQIERLDRIGMRWDSVKDIAWNKYYTAAVDYYKSHGSLDPTGRFVTEDGVRLGAWLTQLRTHRRLGYKSSYLTPEHIAELDALGMIWDVYDFVFERNYHSAVAYYREHGDLNCRHDYVDENGIKLGAWLSNLRQQYKKRGRSVLTEEQFSLMEQIGIHWGSKYDKQWDAAYAELCEYYREHGKILMPVAYMTESGLRLGRWLRRQQELHQQGKLRTDRIELLEKVGVVWETVDSWEEKFQLVKAYSEEHGGISDMKPNCVVNGVWLHKWLSEQKLVGEGKRKKKLTDEQRKKLESIGMVFGQTLVDQTWEMHYQAVKEYVESTGSTVIPKDLQDTDGVNLKIWTNRQLAYAHKGQLSEDKAEKLRKIGFVLEAEDPFEVGYAHAKAYFDTYGDLLVKSGYICEDGYNLASWIRNMRHKKTKLSEERLQMLQKIGMVWDVHEHYWQQMYESASLFYAQNGHLRLPVGGSGTNDRALYEWLQGQKKAYKQGKLSADRVSLLRKIGLKLGDNPTTDFHIKESTQGYGDSPRV